MAMCVSAAKAGSSSSSSCNNDHDDGDDGKVEIKPTTTTEEEAAAVPSSSTTSSGGVAVPSSIISSSNTDANANNNKKDVVELEGKEEEDVQMGGGEGSSSSPPLLQDTSNNSSSSNNTNDDVISPDLTFPGRLYLLLKHAEHSKLQSIMSWTQNGNAFQVHNKTEFELHLLPKYFKMTKYKNFTRQLRAYGFTCINSSNYSSVQQKPRQNQQHKQLPSYSHPNFKSNDPDGCYNITRKTKPATTIKAKETINNNNNNTTSSSSVTDTTTANDMSGKNYNNNNMTLMHSTCTGEFKPDKIEHKSNQQQQTVYYQQQQQLQGANVSFPNGAMMMMQQQQQQQHQQCQAISMESHVSGNSCVSPSLDSWNSSKDGDKRDDSASLGGHGDNRKSSSIGNNSNSNNNNNTHDEEEEMVMQVDLDTVLGPRPVEEMVADAADPFEPLPIWWYEWCPTMTPIQQAIMEYSLPATLPATFYALNFSPFGLCWAIVLVVGHTIETMITNFGPAVKDYRLCSIIGPVKHQMMDSMWMHTLLSAMLLFPQYFVSSADDDATNNARSIGFIIGLCLIPSQPIPLAVSFKTHFTSHILPRLIHHREIKHQPNTKEEKATSKTTTTRTIKDEKQKSILVMENMIRSCFVGYYASLLLCYVGEYYFDGDLNPIKIISVFMLNMAPLMTARSYIYQVVTTTATGTQSLKSE